MIRIEQEASKDRVHDVTLTLPFELRQKSRLRVRLDDGTDAALVLPRGRVLRGGDQLLASDGRVVRVLAASECVSMARTEQPSALVRAAYHLGNRHVPVELGEGYVCYVHDHVLDEMVRGLGLWVRVEMVTFEPEGGAYAGGHGHGIAAGQGHGHHGHDHDHAGATRTESR
jgi:urease accessory protein